MGQVGSISKQFHSDVVGVWSVSIPADEEGRTMTDPKYFSGKWEEVGAYLEACPSFFYWGGSTRVKLISITAVTSKAMAGQLMHEKKLIEAEMESAKKRLAQINEQLV